MSLSIPHENTRKPLVLLMLSGGVERNQLHEMDQFSGSIGKFEQKSSCFVGAFKNKINRGILCCVGVLVLPRLGGARAYCEKSCKVCVKRI